MYCKMESVWPTCFFASSLFKEISLEDSAILWAPKEIVSILVVISCKAEETLSERLLSLSCFSRLLPMPILPMQIPSLFLIGITIDLKGIPKTLAGTFLLFYYSY